MHAHTIKDVAMLVSLTINGWTGRITDRNASASVTANAGARSDAAAVRKNLLTGCDAALRAVNASAHAARATHRALTLPWSESTRILPAAQYPTYAAEIDAALAAHASAVETFLSSYSAAADRARAALGALYNERDYPRTETLRAKFRASVMHVPFPDVSDWRIDVADGERAAIAARTQREIEDRLRVAVSDVWERLADVLSTVGERLADPDAVFRDSLIGNVRALLATVPRLNVTNDVRMAAAVADVERAVAQYDPQTLRDVAPLRAQVARDAARLAATYAGLAV